jgi:hypothetical protein
MRPIPRGKYLDERHRRSASEAAYSHIRCPECGGWIDVSDLGSVVDHAHCHIQQSISRSEHLET